MSIYPEGAYAEYSVGDDRPFLRVQFVDENGEPRDLSASTGATIRGRLVDTTVTLIQKSMTLIDELTGIYEAQWADGDLDVPAGEYEFEREILFGVATPETLPGMLKVIIHEKFADIVP